MTTYLCPGCRRCVLCGLLTLLSISVFAQVKENLRYRNKKFQFSIFPGVGTNGLESGHYFNHFSLNLTSNVSAGSYYLDLSLISSMSLRSVSGLQVSGLANIVGGNSYVNLTRWEERELRRSEDAPKLQGIQLAGVLNFVRDDAIGIQMAGGMNINQGDTRAFQFAGLGNEVGFSFAGVQVAGLFNNVHRAVSGTQISLAYNRASWELQGFQVGMINHAKQLKGGRKKHGVPGKGFQIGLINRAKEMNGFQIGLINSGGRARGTRIGLINVYSVGPFEGGVHGGYGVPVALLNIGSRGSHFRASSDELFMATIEYTTGNCMNCSWTQSMMPHDGHFMIVNQNALILAYNPTDAYGTNRRIGLGYGFERIYYNKASMVASDSRNKRYFLSMGISAMHLSTTRKISRDLSLIGRLHGEAGIRISSFYLFGGLSINGHLSQNAPLDTWTVWSEGPVGNWRYQLWPGYQFGIQL